MNEEAKNVIDSSATNPTKKEEEKKCVYEGESGDSNTHAYMVLGTRFEIEKRYEIIDPIGSGAYGVVVAAKDTSLEE